MVSPSPLLKALHVEIRARVLEQLWHSSNLPFNHQARKCKNRMSVSVSIFFLLKKRKYESKFSASFCLAIQREWEEGRKYRGKNTQERNKQHTQTHMHIRTRKKKQGTSLTYEYHMQMEGREQMLLHLIDLYENCIQTFQCLLRAHCELSSLAF